MSKDPFEALADPTRRRLLQILRSGERSVNELAEPFSVTRSAISQQLGILREAGLVSSRKVGRHRMYHLEMRGMEPVLDWVGYFSDFWDDKLEALQRHMSQPDDTT